MKNIIQLKNIFMAQWLIHIQHPYKNYKCKTLSTIHIWTNTILILWTQTNLQLKKYI